MAESSEQPISLSDLEGLGIDPEALRDFDLLADGVFKILSENLGFVIPGVLVYDEKEDGLRLVRHTIPASVVRIVNAVLSKDISRTVFSLSEKENIMVRAYLTQEFFTDSTVRKMTLPYITSGVVEQIDKFLNVKMVAAFPMVVAGKSQGVFVFGSRTKSNISQREKEFLTNFSAHVGQYLQTAWLLKQAVEARDSLESHKKDLEKLIKVKQEFLLDVSTLLSGLTSEFGLKEEKREDIKDTLKYLKSLFLLSTSLINKENKSERDQSK